MRITEFSTTPYGEGGFAVLEADDPARVIARNPISPLPALAATSVPAAECTCVVKYGENRARIASVG